jgi:hypothetical protein
MATHSSKAQQARELSGDKLGTELEPLRAALLIAKLGNSYSSQSTRVYWPKSVWATLEEAQAALKAAGLSSGLAFTQYRAAGPFKNLAEMVSARSTHKPQEGTMTEQDTTTTPETTPEQEAAKIIAEVKPSRAKTSKAKTSKASKAKPKTTSKAKPKTAPKGSWAQRNPEAVATIPALIKQGQHPQQFADANGISIAIAWRLFKAEGWVATGKGGGGKAFAFADQAQQDEAHAALQTLSDIAQAAGVSINRVIKEVQSQAK